MRRFQDTPNAPPAPSRSRPLHPSATLGERLVRPIMLFIALLCIGTFGYYSTSHAVGNPVSVRNCLYQTSILLTGVGFADVLESNNTWPTALFTVGLCFVGFGTILYIVSTITAFIVGGELTDYLENRKMEKRIAALQHHYIICGGGRTGEHVVREMTETKRPFLLIENNVDTIERLQHEHGEELIYLHADASDDEVLRRAGIERAAGLVSALPEDKDNLLVVISARQLNPMFRIISRCVDLENMRKLRKAGANSVVSPNRIGGLRLASEMVRPAVVSFLDTMLRDRRMIRFEEIQIPDEHFLVGNTLAEAKLPAIADINIIAARHAPTEDFIYNPHGNLIINGGIELVAIGSPDEVQKLRKHLKLDQA